MISSIIQIVISIFLGFFMLGVLGAKSREEKEIYFSMAFFLLLALLITIKI